MRVTLARLVELLMLLCVGAQGRASALDARWLAQMMALFCTHF